jgi:hypothetical protein
LKLKKLKSLPGFAIGLVPGARQNRQVALSIAEAGSELTKAGAYALEAIQRTRE